MKFVKVNEVPESRHNHKLKEYWDRFMSMKAKVVKVDLDECEYKNVAVAYRCMGASVRRYGLPINVMKRGNEIFLVRRDI